MAFSNGIFLVNQAITRFKTGMRDCMIASAIILGGAIILACALGFGLTSAYLALAREMPDYQAALWMAVGLVVLGGVVIAIAVAITRRQRPKSLPATGSEQPIDAAQPVEQITDAILRDATSQASRKPVSTMSTALLLGLVVGLLRQNGDK